MNPPASSRRSPVLNRRHAMLLGSAALLAAPRVHAQASAVPPEVAAEVDGARLLGKGLLRFLGLRVYEARLFVPAAAPGEDWAAAPLALELQYARSLEGAKIAERSLTEMRRQADIDNAKSARWVTAMKQVFPDVKEGDRITGVLVPGMGARFFINGQMKGDIRDPEFARLFFGIWLSPKTSEPALRDALLGKAS
jgi:Chalcone isomerase-like